MAYAPVKTALGKSPAFVASALTSFRRGTAIGPTYTVLFVSGVDPFDGEVVRRAAVAVASTTVTPVEGYVPGSA